MCAMRQPQMSVTSLVFFVVMVGGQDMSYIATQNFLIDLPYRNGSYASMLQRNVKSGRLPEYSDCVDPVTGVNACSDNPCSLFGWGDTHIDTSSNSAQYIASRKVGRLTIRLRTAVVPRVPLR